jgi:UDP-N-acetylglucosamine 2-epimerase (non-hydrolysing)
MKLILVAGARPNFMKIAPIIKEMKRSSNFEVILVHTGQHYDSNMSKVFFTDLGIPKPDLNLEIGSGSHAWQTAEIMKKFESVLIEETPDMIMVVGDVNSTIACSLTAAKMGVKIAHVEAGLRSNNWRMPEEINRVLTDRLSDLLFTSCSDAKENLLSEGIDENRIHFVGNVMIDSLLSNSKKADLSMILDNLGISQGNYTVLTLHRPSNVDSRDNLESIISILEEAQKHINIIYPMHPRTKKQFETLGILHRIESLPGLRIIDPVGYLDFMKLIKNAKLVLTDSGGIQEETTVLGVACLTMRKETERPVTIKEGTNTIVGLDKELIIDCIENVLNGNYKKGITPDLWDGKAAERIIQILMKIEADWNTNGMMK